jgi:hypothetical protein
MRDKSLSAALYALVTLSPSRLRAAAGVWFPRCVIRASNITVFLYSHNFVQNFGETPCRVARRSRGTKGRGRAAKLASLLDHARPSHFHPQFSIAHISIFPIFLKRTAPLMLKLNSPNPSEFHLPPFSAQHICVDSSARILCVADADRARRTSCGDCASPHIPRAVRTSASLLVHPRELARRVGTLT